MYTSLLDWDFRLEKAGKRWLSGNDSAGGERVSLPHCWNVTDTFQYDVNYYMGWGSYRCSFHFTPDAERPHAVLRSNGFYGTGELWLDGALLTRFDAQYLGLWVALPELSEGEHTLAIRLTNRCAKEVLPGIKMPDFVLYGGLACDEFVIEQRRAAFLVADRLCVVPEGADAYRVSGSVEHGESVSGKHPVVSLTIPELGVQMEVPLDGAEFSEIVRVENPEPWSIDHPRRYALTVQLQWDGGEDESHERLVGFRTIEFTADRGFLLNGEPVFLAGCNRHECMPGFGNALSVAQHREDARLLKDSGANLVRLSHYPQHKAFLDACDELGLCVYAEIATWKSARGGRWLENAKRQMREMILRDGHHASFIVWGLGNETRKRKPYLELQAIVRALDPGRPTIYAENHIYRGRREDTLDLPDMLGVNYELDILDEALEVSRNGYVLVSESSSHPTERGHMEDEREQVQMLDREIAKMRPYPGVAGFSMWCFADYATLRKKRYKRFSGLVDAWRVPKPGYDYFRACYAKDPVIALHGDWSRESRDALRTITVLSNRAPGTLMLEGDVVHEWSDVAPVQTIQLSWRDAPLQAEAGGEMVELVPHGPAVSVVVEPQDDGSVMLYAVDAEQRVVRTFNQEIDLPDAERIVPFRPDGKVELRAGSARVFLRKRDDSIESFTL